MEAVDVVAAADMVVEAVAVTVVVIVMEVATATRLCATQMSNVSAEILKIREQIIMLSTIFCIKKSIILSVVH